MIQEINLKKTGNHTLCGICSFFLLCIIVLFISLGCEYVEDIEKMEVQIEVIDPNVVEANTAFGFNLFHEIRKSEQDKNIFISPFSVSVALAMTLNGAAGETETAMVDTLQLQDIETATINPNYALLQQTLEMTDPKVTLTIANSLWAEQSFSFNPEFLNRNSHYFDAEISSLDFANPTSVDTINQWVNDSTSGKITEILDEISSDEVLFLINAIYFKGSWQTEFDPSKTRDGKFHLSDGTTKQVPMMVREDKYPFYYGENFQAISLPYGDGNISMYIFLPFPNSDLNTLLDSLNTENWESSISQFREQKVWVQIPKFKLEYRVDLSDMLKVLGMEVAFVKNRADFSRMSSDRDLYISRVDHKAVVEVNEEGTEAAAVTNVGIAVTSLPPQFIADRPFFFAIRDNETKTVLFMGTVVDPSE